MCVLVILTFLLECHCRGIASNDFVKFKQASEEMDISLPFNTNLIAFY